MNKRLAAVDDRPAVLRSRNPALELHPCRRRAEPDPERGQQAGRATRRHAAATCCSVRVRRRLQLTPAGSLYLVEVEQDPHPGRHVHRYVLRLRRRDRSPAAYPLHRPSACAGWCPASRAWRLRHRISTWTCATNRKPIDLAARLGATWRSTLARAPGRAPTCLKLFREELVPVCAPGSLAGTPFTDPTQTRRPGAAAKRLAARRRGTTGSDSQGYTPTQLPRAALRNLLHVHPRRAGRAVAWRWCRSSWWQEELADGKLVIPWNHAMPSTGAHYLAYAEHAAEVPKVRALVEWMLEQLQR